MSRRSAAALGLSFLFFVAAGMWAYAHDRERSRSSRLTPPEGAPFPGARGEVELKTEALVVEVEGLPEGEYTVCLDDGTGTLASIGTIQVAARVSDGDDDDDDGDESSGDGGGGDGDDDDDDGGEGDDDDDAGPSTEGSLSLSGDTLPFGATSPAELAGRAISVKDAAEVVLLQGMTPSPIVKEPEERAGRCPLAPPEPAPDPNAEGVLVLEQGDGRIVIKVRVSGLEPATVYDVVLTNPADSMSEVIGMITTDDEGEGKLKIDTDKGDAVPFGAADLAALEGFEVAVEAPDDAVVLTGTVCPAEIRDDDDDDDDGDGGDGDDDDGDEGDDDDDDGGDGDDCEADLARAEASPDADAEGEAEIEGEVLEVEVKRLDAGTYEVFLIDPAEGGEAVSIGSITTGEDGRGELEFMVEEGGSLPFGKTSMAEFVNFIVEVRTGDGTVVLAGTLPAVPCEPDDDGDGDDDGDDDDDDGEGDGDGDDDDDDGEGDGDDDGDDDDDDGEDGGEGDDDDDDDDGDEGMEGGEEPGDGEEPGEEMPGEGETTGGGAGIGIAPPAAETLFVLEGQFDAPFLRGDSNRDGAIDITDPLNALQFLFSGGARPYCLDASDANDDGEVNISDAISLLGYLFLGTARPAEPGTMIPGFDPTADRLYCEEEATP